MLSSNPIPRFTSSDLIPINSNNRLTFQIENDKFSVSNFKEFPANTEFEIKGLGLKNPTSGVNSFGWKIEINLNGNLLNKKVNL